MEIVIIVISTLISSLGILFSFKNLYKEKINIKKDILFLLILTILVSLIVILFSGLTKLLFNYLAILFSMYFILLDKNIHKSLSYTTTIFLGFALIEILLTIILKTVINFDELYNKYILTLLLFNLVVNIILVLVTKLNFIIKISNKQIFSNNTLKIVLFLMIIIICLIGIQNKNIINTYNISYIINILMFIFVFVILYIIIDINNRNKEISNKYNQMMEFMTEYENIIDEQGKANHEYKNQLLILNGFIDNKKKLKEYLDTIIEDHKTGQNYEVRQLSHFPNGGLKGLLYYKISKMKENNIKYFLYVSKEVNKPLEKLDIKDYKSITKIFGVLIDNAIDASLNSSGKEVMLDFKMDDNYLVITITNTYNDDVDLSKLGTGYTSKGNNHGYGLRLVKDIIMKNKKIELVTDKNDTQFIQTLLIDTK